MRLKLHRPAGPESRARAPEDREARRPGADLRPAADVGELRPAGDLRAPLRARVARGRRRVDPGLRARAPRAPQHRDRAHRDQLQGRFRRHLERRSRERRLQPPAAGGRAQRPRDRGAARLLPLPAADRRALQPGVHGAHARRPTPRIARNLVRLFETRFDPADAAPARQRRARPSAPPRRSAPTSTR